jgi:ATP/maltotriose-dependent transcriptional regulator MalT
LAPQFPPQPSPGGPSPDLARDFSAVAFVASGGLGSVYRAIDPQGRAVAIKVLDAAHAADAAAAWQFVTEFRRLSRLAHPSFPRALAEGRTADGLPYFTMEFVSGGELTPRERPEDRPDAGRLREIMRQIAGALGVLHGHGLVHGDLKLPNLLQTPDGRVVLLDLGQSAVVGEVRPAQGTPEYLAPEVLTGRPCDPRSDLYALGVCAYALASGSLPFAGRLGDVVRQQIASAPARLDVSGDPELGALIGRLLAKDPADRPATIAALIALLAGYGAAGKAVIAGDPGDPGGPGEPGEPGELGESGDARNRSRAALRLGAYVGRTALQAAWQAALDQADQRWVEVVGGGGGGKTRAVEECRLEALQAGRRWFGLACTGSAAVPAGPLRALAAQLARAAGLVPDGMLAAWLAGLTSPALADLEPDARTFAVSRAFADLFGQAAARLGPIAIGLDDWHLADAASRKLVEFVARACPDLPAAWVAAGAPRDGESPRHGFGSIVSERTAPHPTIPQPMVSQPILPQPVVSQPMMSEPIELEAIGEAELVRWLQSRLGEALPDGLATEVQNQSAGVPAIMEAVLDHLVDQGALWWTGARWEFSSARPVRDRSAWWQEALHHLSGPARQLAAVAAVAWDAGDLPVPLLAAAGDSGAAGEAVATAAEALAAARLAFLNQGKLRLVHPGLAESLRDSLAPELRRQVADRLAIALLAGTPADRAETAPLDALVRASRLAEHSADPDLAFHLCRAAGVRCLEAPDVGAAAALLERAVRHLGAGAAPAERLSAVLPLAEACRYLDRLDDALGYYEDARAAAEAVGDGTAMAAAALGLSKCHQLRGRYEAAEPLAAQSAQCAAQGDEARSRAILTRARLQQARLAIFAGDRQTARRRAEEAEAVARRAGSLVSRSQALNLLGVLIAEAGDGAAGMAMLTEALALAEQAGDHLSAGFVQESIGNAHLAAGALREAAHAFGRFRDVAHAAGAATETLAAELNLAIVACERGVPDAEPQAAAVARRAAAAGRRFLQAAALAAQAQVLWRGSDVDRAAALLDEALTLAVAIRNRYLEGHVRLYRVEWALARGNLAAAAAEREILTVLADESGEADMRLRVALYGADLAAARGDRALAAAIAREHVAAGNLRVRQHAHRLLAEIALAGEDAAAATAHAQAARAIAEGWEAPWHVDWAQLLGVWAAELAAGAAASWKRRTVPSGTARHSDSRLDLTRPDSRPDPRPSGHESNLARPGASPAAAASGPWCPARLAAFAHALADAHDETEIGQVALRAALDGINAERGYLLLYEAGRLARVVTRGLSYAAELEGGFSTSVVEQVMFTGEALLVADAAADPAWQEQRSVMALRLRTIIAAPVAVADRLLGVLYADREAVDPPLGDADLAAFEALAALAAAAIERERERRAAARRAACAEACAALAERLLAVRLEAEARPARDLVLAAACAAADADAACWLVATLNGSWDAEPGDVPFSRRIADTVAQRREALALLDAARDEAWQESRSVQDLGLKTVWCLPAAGPGLLLYVVRQEPVADEAKLGEILETLAALLRIAAPSLA